MSSSVKAWRQIKPIKLGVAAPAYVFGHENTLHCNTPNECPRFVSKLVSNTLQETEVNKRTNRKEAIYLHFYWCRRGDLNPHEFALTSPSIS